VPYAGVIAPVEGVRVGPVYTARASAALDGGAAACMLYADLADRTSNEITQRSDTGRWPTATRTSSWHRPPLLQGHGRAMADGHIEDGLQPGPLPSWRHP
jgi:hypothetical protein